MAAGMRMSVISTSVWVEVIPSKLVTPRLGDKCPLAQECTTDRCNVVVFLGQYHRLCGSRDDDEDALLEGMMG
jgi:hypothetical protein